MLFRYFCQGCEKELFNFKFSESNRGIIDNKGLLIDSINHDGEFGDDGGGHTHLIGHCIRCHQNIEIEMDGSGHVHNAFLINGVEMTNYVKDTIITKSDRYNTPFKNTTIFVDGVCQFNSEHGLTEQYMQEKVVGKQYTLCYSIIDTKDTNLIVDNEKDVFQAFIVFTEYHHYTQTYELDLLRQMSNGNDEYDVTIEQPFSINNIQMKDMKCIVSASPYDAREEYYFVGQKDKMTYKEFEDKIMEFIRSISKEVTAIG